MLKQIVEKEEIKQALQELAEVPIMSGISIGVVGSYARGDESLNSDLDIVLDGDADAMRQFDVVEYAYSFIGRRFPIICDVLWLPQLRQEDEMLDIHLASLGIEANHYSAYKNMCKEVVWSGKISEKRYPAAD